MKKRQQAWLATIALSSAVASSNARQQPSTQPAAQAQTLVGSQAVIKRAMEQPDATTKPSEAKPRTPADDFREAVERLRNAPTVDGWMALCDELISRPAMESTRSSGGDGFQKHGLALLMTAVPPPESWSELAAAIRARPIGEGQRGVAERCLRLIAALLVADEPAAWAELDQIEHAIRELGATHGTSQFASALQQMYYRVAQFSEDGSRELAAFEYQLRRAEAPLDSDELEDMEYFGAHIPDLVRIVGEEQAAGYLRRAVRLPVMITVERGKETQKLARRVALEEIDNLKAPQWNLCFAMEATELFEALRARYIAPVDQARKAGQAEPEAVVRVHAMMDESEKSFEQRDRDDAYASARDYYLVALIAAGRFDEARTIAGDLTDDERTWYDHTFGLSDDRDSAVHAIAKSPHAERAADFFHDLLADNVNLPFWQTYSALEMNLARADRLLELMRKAAERDDLDDDLRYMLHEQLIETLLAVDRVDEAVAMLRVDLTKGLKSNDSSAGITAATKLLKLGVLTEQSDLIAEALAAAHKIIADPMAADERGSMSVIVADRLIALGRYREAEAVIAEELVRTTSQGDPGSMSLRSDTGPAILLSQLARLYWSAGRYEDVVALLDNAPWWGVKDMLQLDQHLRIGNDRESESLAAIAADSLAKVGRADEARRVAQILLAEKPGFDSAYSVIVDADGAQAIAYLDERFGRDQFEERPLIWKAEVLRRAGRLEDAEKTVRQAIAIDPSDGEQGHGDRMRGYAVLAEIRAARGDDKEAAFLRNVVKAIRTAERADDLYNGSLHQRGIDLYNQSLEFFADAYCIQSRLAVQLASLGRHEEAAEHYRRAYELMPDSFGRVESHCFGCENAFDGQSAENLAEQVFTKLAAERPNDARVRYLLGYLREQQARFTEALADYQAAVQLDPDYFNAWLKIRGLEQSVHVPGRVFDDAAVNLYRLRPNTWHCGATLTEMHDLPRLWTVVTQIRPAPPESFDSMYPLAASKTQLEKLEDAQRRAGRHSGYDELRWGGIHIFRVQQPKPATPGEALAEHNAISAAYEMFRLCAEVE